VIHEGLSWLEGSADGKAWLDALPGVIESCAARWGLVLGPPYTYALESVAFPADRADGARVVLKVRFMGRENVREADALQAWDGKGAVRLLDHDPGSDALLLERAEPGHHLSRLEPDAALDVMIGLLPRLWIPAGPPFRPLAEEARDLSEELREAWERTGRTVDRRLVEAALEAFDELSATQGPQVLVNQDLHADNVVAAEREPWLVIDPKPLSGEREFGVAALIRGSELGHSPQAVCHRLDRLSAELGLDRDRALRWALAHTLSWGFGDDEPLTEHVESATWLLDAR